MQAQLALVMLLVEDVETPQCSLATSNAVSPLDISPILNIKKQYSKEANRYSAAHSRLVGGGIKAN